MLLRYYKYTLYMTLVAAVLRVTRSINVAQSMSRPKQNVLINLIMYLSVGSHYRTCKTYKKTYSPCRGYRGENQSWRLACSRSYASPAAAQRSRMAFSSRYSFTACAT